MDDKPLLLAKDSTRGYTDDPGLALPQEPEAVPPEEIRWYSGSIEAGARYRELHAEEEARAALRSRMARIRQAAIAQIKRGKDPVPVLDAVLKELEP